MLSFLCLKFILINDHKLQFIGGDAGDAVPSASRFLEKSSAKTLKNLGSN